MLKYWLRDENSKIGVNIFGNVFEVDIDESGQANFEREHPAAELVGDGSELNEIDRIKMEAARNDGMTVYGPAFPFGAE